MTSNFEYESILHCMLKTEHTCISNLQNKVKGNKRLEICFLFAGTYVKKVWHSIKEYFQNWNIGGKMLKTVLFIAQFASLFQLIYILRKLSICHKTLKEGNCFLLSGNEQREALHWNDGRIEFRFSSFAQIV